ncbi:MAG: F0F1 ATP synthase subunit B [Chloroflexota bacterium]
MDILALVGAAAHQAASVPLAAEAATEPAFQVNLFWVIVSAANFIVFFLIVRAVAFGGLVKTLDDRRTRIEQGLQDAEQARRDRDAAESERLAAINEARREANEIINRAQKASADAREADIAATKEELARLRERAAAEIEAEKQKAIAELRGEVTDLALAAAGRVVADSMTGDRQRKLVADFLAESAGGSRN